MTKNSQPFGKKCQKNSGGIFFHSHCRDALKTAAVVVVGWMDVPDIERDRHDGVENNGVREED